MRRATIVGFAVVALLLALLPAAALAQYGGSAQSSAPAPAAPAAVAPAQASGPAPAQSAAPAPAPAAAQPAAPPPQAAPAAQPTSAPTRLPRGGGSPTSTLPIAGLLAPGLVVGGLLLRRRSGRVVGLGALALALALFAPAASGLAAPASARPPAQVVVPEEDRFAPFALTIHAGQSVEWINRDTDDHTVVSDDAFDSTNHRRTDRLLPGTDSNHGQPGRVTLPFDRPGTFVYYCRFHAHLDGAQQPVAPGPDGGIKDANGNFGTPMMGVVVVLPGED